MARKDLDVAVEMLSRKLGVWSLKVTVLAGTTLVVSAPAGVKLPRRVGGWPVLPATG